MQRIPSTPRPNWQSLVESQGLTYHSPQGEGMDRPYWDESAHYEFSAAEIDTLEAAGDQLQTMCLAAAQHILDTRRFADLNIPAAAIPVIEAAWNAEPPALYGRFDLLWAGARSGSPPKLIEYNADTPTSLLEAAVIQWNWLEDLHRNPSLLSSRPQRSEVEGPASPPTTPLSSRPQRSAVEGPASPPTTPLSSRPQRSEVEGPASPPTTTPSSRPQRSEVEGPASLSTPTTPLSSRPQRSEVEGPASPPTTTPSSRPECEARSGETPVFASGATPKPDQFNSLHEKLIAKWQDITPYIQQPVYFSGVDTAEDTLTLAYLEDTAQQAGLRTARIATLDIGWNEPLRSFVDLRDQPIQTLFKLYPWESLLAEDFGPHALRTYSQMVWIEPVWKLLLSNKGILPILWELYPNHPLLLECYFDSPRHLAAHVRKPLLSREGANIAITYADGTTVETPGTYGDGRVVFQALAPEVSFPDNVRFGARRHPVLGLWMIDQACCGLGIRESAGPVTDNLSSFVPHLFR